MHQWPDALEAAGPRYPALCSAVRRETVSGLGNPTFGSAHQPFDELRRGAWATLLVQDRGSGVARPVMCSRRAMAPGISAPATKKFFPIASRATLRSQFRYTSRRNSPHKTSKGSTSIQFAGGDTFRFRSGGSVMGAGAGPGVVERGNQTMLPAVACSAEGSRPQYPENSHPTRRRRSSVGTRWSCMRATAVRYPDPNPSWIRSPG